MVLEKIFKSPVLLFTVWFEESSKPLPKHSSSLISPKQTCVERGHVESQAAIFLKGSPKHPGMGRFLSSLQVNASHQGFDGQDAAVGIEREERKRFLPKPLPFFDLFLVQELLESVSQSTP